MLLEPMFGVTLTPTMIARLRQDQRDPVARLPQGRLPVPPGLGADVATARDARGARRAGERAEVEFTEQVTYGYASPVPRR
jgi:hypothetical protein